MELSHSQCNTPTPTSQLRTAEQSTGSTSRAGEQRQARTGCRGPRSCGIWGQDPHPYQHDPFSLLDRALTLLQGRDGATKCHGAKQPRSPWSKTKGKRRTRAAPKGAGSLGLCLACCTSCLKHCSLEEAGGMGKADGANKAHFPPGS